jgi:hypothetical protein
LAKKTKRPARELTKRQLSHWQQQKKRQRIINAAGIFVIAAILTIIGAGWYLDQYRPLREIVIRVNDTKLNMDYYVKMLKFYAEGESAYYLVDEVVRVIQQNELVRQEAEGKLGISVSQDAVDKELKQRNPPLSKDYQDAVRAPMLMTKLRDEYFEPKVPKSTEHRKLMVMFLESENQATEVKARLEKDEDFAELADNLSLDGLAPKGDLDWQPKGVLTLRLGTSVVEDYAFSAEIGTLSPPLKDDTKTKKVGYWLIEVLEREEDAKEAYVQAILLGSQEEAQKIKARLEAGEDFATLAKEVSQLQEAKENGGYLGLLTPGEMSQAFDDIVFGTELKPKTISEPVRDDTMTTKGGYWLVKVLDKEDNREIGETDRNLLMTKAFNDWILTLSDDPKNIVESYLDSQKKAWAINRALKS